MKKIVTIGGGTGTFAVLSGLKKYPDADLSAVVSVSDDGGSTGRLRDAYGHLPQGDVRQALVALSEDQTLLRQLFSHRFGKGDIAGHNFGNLFLTALTEMLGSGGKALEEAGKLLRIRGRVIPVSDSPGILCAEYLDGSRVEGESNIGEAREERGPISRLYLKETCVASQAAVDAIYSADRIVLGPGDIYTSTLANFVTEGLSHAVRVSKGRLIYVMPLFSTPESGVMTMSDYLTIVTKYTSRAPDVVVVNSGHLPKEALDHYLAKGQYPIFDDVPLAFHVVRSDLVSREVFPAQGSDPVDRSLVRHDPNRLADVLMTL